MFGREVTRWGRELVDRSHRRPPLTEEELSAYHEIFFVAQRTQVVAPLIWYPLVVLTLMIVARLSFFFFSMLFVEARVCVLLPTRSRGEERHIVITRGRRITNYVNPTHIPKA